jgi:hypothetical protein
MQQSNEVPQEIKDWIDEILPKIINNRSDNFRPSDWESGALSMYRHLAPRLASLTHSAEVLKMIRPEEPTLKEMHD